MWSHPSFILALLVCVFSTESTTRKPINGLDDLWGKFIRTNNKNYETQEEEMFRRKVWEENTELIQKHNLEYDLGFHTYTLGINEYADLTFKEYQQQLLGTRVPISQKTFNITDSKLKLEKHSNKKDADLPTSVDWRQKGYVTPVKNQKNCGSCWAFSSTGALEGQHYKATGKLVSLSEQNLVDCPRSFGNFGCQGGWQKNAFEYIRQNGGIDREDCYPYNAWDGRCKFDRSCIGATVKSYGSVSRGSEIDLEDATANIGPIAVAIDSSHNSFMFYKSGLYYEPRCSSTSVSHAVLVVGYGETNYGKYWLVKNSWGSTWGEGGYIRMAKDRHNNCAIASFASYPLVN